MSASLRLTSRLNRGFTASKVIKSWIQSTVIRFSSESSGLGKEEKDNYNSSQRDSIAKNDQTFPVEDAGDGGIASMLKESIRNLEEKTNQLEDGAIIEEETAGRGRSKKIRTRRNLKAASNGDNEEHEDNGDHNDDGAGGGRRRDDILNPFEEVKRYDKGDGLFEGHEENERGKENDVSSRNDDENDEEEDSFDDEDESDDDDEDDEDDDEFEAGDEDNEDDEEGQDDGMEDLQFFESYARGELGAIEHDRYLVDKFLVDANANGSESRDGKKKKVTGVDEDEDPFDELLNEAFIESLKTSSGDYEIYIEHPRSRHVQIPVPRSMFQLHYALEPKLIVDPSAKDGYSKGVEAWNIVSRNVYYKDIQKVELASGVAKHYSNLLALDKKMESDSVVQPDLIFDRQFRTGIKFLNKQLKEESNQLQKEKEAQLQQKMKRKKGSRSKL